MSWILSVGSRSLEFRGDLSGVGLMGTPQVRPLVEFDAYANARGDGRRLGRVYRRGQVVSLSVEARPDLRPMGDVWRDLLGVWRADEIRDRPGVHAVLTAPSGRHVLGMPVELDPNEEYRLFDTNRAVLSFECVDDLWYGPEEQTTIRFVPPVSGGLTFPAEAPFTFDSGPAVRNASVQVTGDVSTWPVFEIKGPVTNPEVDIVGVGKLIFSVDLAYDQTLRVDTRPWARWVKRDGAAFPGALSSAGARLSDVSLPPGTYQVLLRGYDPTGTAELRVSTWPAFTSF